MLTTPSGEFAVADDDALAVAIGVQNAAEETLDGVMTVEGYLERHQRDPTINVQAFFRD
jgi:hypothetical protein